VQDVRTILAGVPGLLGNQAFDGDRGSAVAGGGIPVGGELIVDCRCALVEGTLVEVSVADSNIVRSGCKAADCLAVYGVTC